jgi:hypothetical protein
MARLSLLQNLILEEEVIDLTSPPRPPLHEMERGR